MKQIMHKEIEKAINSRAKLLNRRYSIPYNDLVNDGYLHVFEFKIDFPDAELLQVLKSINWFYSNMERKLRLIRRKETSIEELPEDIAAYEMEEIVLDDLELETTAKTKFGSDAHIIQMLKKGESIANIKDLLGLDSNKWREIRRRILKK